LKDENDTSYEPVNSYYSKLKEKLRLYRNIQKKGGFPILKLKEEFLFKTESDSVLIQVKERLFLSGDLKVNDNNVLYTMELANAISNFQQRVGLPSTGKLDFKTIAEMNKTVDFRIKQILVNLERLRWIPDTIENDYLLVNIPEYKLHIIKNNKLLWETNVIVGKEAKRTSVFRGNIARIILNPYWNIPNSIINEEILPKLKKNSTYLDHNNMEVVAGEKVIDASKIDWNKYTKNIPYQIRQKPGPDNALGKMKFLFPNNFNIYLHDTPAKELFNQRHRDFSHGCIRVENPKKLALYLLQNNTVWNEEKVNRTLETNTETDITIKPKMPVYIVYFTAWVDSKNNLNFRNDIYNLDEQLAKNIFEEN
jgi:murein L,D-transpeptidase YcbB/YkuD